MMQPFQPLPQQLPQPSQKQSQTTPPTSSTSFTTPTPLLSTGGIPVIPHTIEVDAPTFVSNVLPPKKKQDVYAKKLMGCTLDRAVYETLKQDTSSRVVVLNFANYKSPYARVSEGYGHDAKFVKSQEEELFQVMPSLQRSLMGSGCYPFNPESTLLWTPRVPFEISPLSKDGCMRNPHYVSVVSVATPLPMDRRKLDPNEFMNVLHAAIVVPSSHLVHYQDKSDIRGNNLTLVIGLGNGTFEGERNIKGIANLIREVLKRGLYGFKQVTFAIPNTRDYRMFDEEINKK
jgi:hypothetical protein